MLKFGFITEIDHSKGFVRVNFADDDIVSSPLPVSVPASKKDKYTFPFSINEQVWCLMDENSEFGVVGGAIYSEKDKPPQEATEDKLITDMNEGTFRVEIDKASGKFKISNSDVSLKELFDDLKILIENLKVKTSSGPSVGLLPDTINRLNQFGEKYEKILS